MLGFVILSHDNSAQLLRLIITLGKHYSDPPIACHHDWSQSALDPAAFPANVRFVREPLRTRWAHWSVTAAGLAALGLLYDSADPEWFTLMSAADYPIRRGADVEADLRAASVDAFLDLRPVGGSRPDRHVGLPDPSLACHDDLQLATRRYRQARLMPPAWLARRVSAVRQSYRLPFVAPWSPFDESYRCYVGSQWFTGHRRAAHSLLEPSRRDEALQKYYATRWHADESYVNTVIGNRADLRVDVDPRRFSAWDSGSAHPRVLEEADVPAILSSAKHFARKFVHRSPALDILDEQLGIR